MANTQHLEMIEQGGKVWNRWRETSAEPEPDLSAANLKGADLRNTDLSGVNLMEANLREAKFHWANLRGANLRKADLKGAIFVETDLRDANFSWADLREADFKRANLRNALLSWANMKEASLKEVDLQQANLLNADLRCAVLRESSLKQADLREAYLSNAEFVGVNMESADLREADLRGAHLLHVSLKHADLSECRIYGISAWELEVDDTTNQQDMILTDWDEPIITIDGFNVAQFMYLFLHTPQIPKIFEAITSQIVLLLGRFGAERKAVLDTLRMEFRQRDYLPVLLDFQKPESEEFMGMVSILGHVSRYVIADLTQPQNLARTAEHLLRAARLPFLPILTRGSETPTALGMMTLQRETNLLAPVWYADPQELRDVFHAGILTPVEKKFQELQT